MNFRMKLFFCVYPYEYAADSIINFLCCLFLAGSLSLHVGFLQWQQAGAALWLWCAGCSLRWLLLLGGWALGA